MAKGVTFALSFVVALAAWTLLWVCICTFSMWHLSWPGTWDEMGRLLFIIIGGLLATAFGLARSELLD